MTFRHPPPGFPLPTLRDSRLVVGPPSNRAGSWAGAPCAITSDGSIYLAYRLRRPIGEGRGFRNVVAVSTDGVAFETVATVDADRFGAESLERTALTVTPDGRWRLYVSCATPGTKHWRIDLLESSTPQGLAVAPARTVLPGSGRVGVKDPVVVWNAGRWHLWASVHPLDLPEHTDRMTTDYATSDDGVRWQWHGSVLTGRRGEWDARGVRVSSVHIDGDMAVASYDGRATAEQNWEERTGLAIGRRCPSGGFGVLEQLNRPAVGSEHGLGGLRYLSALSLPDGTSRIYYEYTRRDGAHELRTELIRDADLTAAADLRTAS